MVPARKLIAFRLAALAGSLLLCEAALSLAAAWSPALRLQLTAPWNRDPRIPDPDLGWRLTPHYPGNDAWGFRNPKVPERTDILALGDSMTYGFAAPADRCWPRELERLNGKAVYNMSCGGYSPVEYHALLDRGLTLNPSTVIVAMYMGNDFAEAYRAVYVEGRGRSLRLSDDVIERIGARTAIASPTRFERMAESEAGAMPRAGSEPGGLRRWLSEHSSLYGLARAVYTTQAGLNQGLGEDAGEHPFELAVSLPGRIAFDADTRFRTVFLDPAYSSQALNLDDPRIRAGNAIIQRALQDIDARLRTRGIRLLVVLFPTKETVYADLMRAQRGVPEGYFRLLEHERRLTEDLDTFLTASQIEFVDLTDALRSGLEHGVAPFPHTDNTHPNADGYALVAVAIGRALGSDER